MHVCFQHMSQVLHTSIVCSGCREQSNCFRTKLLLSPQLSPSGDARVSYFCICRYYTHINSSVQGSKGQGRHAFFYRQTFGNSAHDGCCFRAMHVFSVFSHHIQVCITSAGITHINSVWGRSEGCVMDARLFPHAAVVFYDDSRKPWFYSVLYSLSCCGCCLRVIHAFIYYLLPANT